MGWHWLRHDWGQWSKVHEESWSGLTVVHGVPLPGTERFYMRSAQHRTCATCGVIQKRYVA